jgi:phosphoglucomutase
MNPTILNATEAAVASGNLLTESQANIVELLHSTEDPVTHGAVEELASAHNWSELNDRFFKKLAFGTGGLRSRTIGRVVTTAEQGQGAPLDRPEYPCVGTNAMNFYNISKATQGMIRYLKDYHEAEGRDGLPAVVIAHDTRHFSRDFAERAAKVAAENGCDAYLFEDRRSTPELSFAVRHLGATGGIMLTASHNPSHDNGFKAYFEDGAQLVEPHASRVVELVQATTSDSYDPLPTDEQGRVIAIGREVDEAYLKRLENLVLQPDIIREATDLKIVFTNLHGTGGFLVPTILHNLGFDFETVATQDDPDGRFPTVPSPNPENASALKLAIEHAEAIGADLVIGTDPDCDRMGAGVRDKDGNIQLLTGNQIGSLMAYYRCMAFAESGIIHPGNRDHAVLIKTFVTTELQRAIANHFDIPILDTLTGFKYIGAKLRKYEESLPQELRDSYRGLTTEEQREIQLTHGTFFVFGGEESYGYLGADFVRDKDGNGSVIILGELAAYAASQGMNLLELLDKIYSRFGYFLEQGKAKVFEGADGAAKIARLAESYGNHPPVEIDGSRVTCVRNFATEDFTDEEGESIPKEKMLFVDLDDGRSFAVRPSGTEPKIKYYLYGRSIPAEGETFNTEELRSAKLGVEASLASLWTALEDDIGVRLG